MSDGASDQVPGAASVDELPSGKTFGHFLIHCPLGRGGMAAVYEALDTRLDRTVALKVLPSEFLHDPTFGRRFENEARLIASLEHPNIVPIYEAGIEAGVPWMSMRLLAGGTLGALLERGRLAPAEVVRLLRQVAAALDHAHAVGVVHRDVKPANILLDAAGTACVADFGLAQMMERDARLTQTGMLTGTPHYMAPEQALGKRVDHRCDIYSLGIVAYEMLVGTPPFAAESPVAVLLHHVHEPLPIPHGPLSNAPWIEPIKRAAAKNPTDRWPSAGAFVDALEPSLRAAPVPAQQEKRLLPWATARGAALAGGIVLSAAALAWLLVLQPQAVPPEPQPAAATERKEEVLSPPVQAPDPDTSDVPAPVQKAPPRRVSPGGAGGAPQEASRTPLPPPSGDAAPTGFPVPSATPPASLPGTLLTIEPFAPKLPAPAAPAAPDDEWTAPQVIHEVKPTYPPAASLAGLEGDVVLAGIVGVDGRVSNISVVRSEHHVLTDAARKAWLQFRYKPAQRNGIAVPEAVKQPFSFKMKSH